MGCGASADLRYAIPDPDAIKQIPLAKKIAPTCTINEQAPWHLPDGGCVVALFDYDPSCIDWPTSWGSPLPLQTSMLVQVTGDEGNEIAYGYPLKQPGKHGYFLKQYAMPLTDCLRPSEQGNLNFGRTGKDVSQKSDDVENPSANLKIYPGTGAPPSLPESRPAPPPLSRQGRLPHDICEPLRGDCTREPLIAKSPLPKATARAQFRWNEQANERDNIATKSCMPEEASRYSTTRHGPQSRLLECERGSRGLIQTPKSKSVAKTAPNCRIANSLGLLEGCDEPFRWLVDFEAAGELTADWERLFDDEGREAFYHPATKRVSRQHPTMVKYKHFLKKLRDFHQRGGVHPDKVRPHIALIFNDMLNRCHKELPPVTPEIVERIAVLLNIDTAFEYSLTTQLKLLMEAYVEDQYDIAVQVHDKLDADSFIAHLRKKQVEIEVLSKPDVVIMCSEIDGLAASVKCEQCLDYFSLEGFAKVHVAGRRKLHTAVKCEQTVCSVYPGEFATCEVDGMLYCDRAYEEIAAKNPTFRQHRRRILGGLFCSQYLTKKAEVLCEDCADLFCMEAFIELHNHGSRRQHVPLRLNENCDLLRAGEIIPPEETSRLLCRSRLARDGGPWLAFRDDQLNSYWYHLRDKVISTHNPYL